MTEATPPRGIRLSDAERDHAAQRLHRAMAEGRITLDEFEQRIAAVYDAKYAADLKPIFADLPPQTMGWSATGGMETLPAAADAGGATPSSVPARPAALGGVDLSGVTFPPEPVVLDAGWSTLRRKERWLVPGWLRLKTGPGTIVLDCREATFAQQVTAIDVEIGMGTVKIIVPEGVTADVNAVSVGLGTVSCKVPSLTDGAHPHLICAGRVGAGTLVIRRAYF